MWVLGLIEQCVGAFGVLFGLFGIARTYQVRPRAKRPELAPMLYVEFAAMAVLGVVMILSGAQLR